MYPNMSYTEGKIVAPRLTKEQQSTARSSANCGPGVNICEKVDDIVKYASNHNSVQGIFLVSYDTADILGPRIYSISAAIDHTRGKLRLSKIRVLRLVARKSSNATDGQFAKEVRDLASSARATVERRRRVAKARRKLASRLKKTGKK